MKKSHFWGFFIFGIIFLAVGTFLLFPSGTKNFESTMLMIILYLIGLALVIGAGYKFGEGDPRDYLLNRTGYRKITEHRYGKNGTCALLLCRGTKDGKFYGNREFHLIESESILDEKGNTLKNIPKTFFVKTSKVDDKTLYYIIPTRSQN